MKKKLLFQAIILWSVAYIGGFIAANLNDLWFLIPLFLCSIIFNNLFFYWFIKEEK
jgi:hypothetical protein